MRDIQTFVGEHTGIPVSQVNSALNLMKEGGTIPFIARYRKEATGNLDEVQLRNIQEKAEYFQELAERIQTILQSIESQNKLTPELRRKIESCENKQQLEDLYLPYKPKRKTRATEAKALGLEPLAELIMGDADFEKWCAEFLNTENGQSLDTERCVAGAMDIIAEQIAEDAEVLGPIRDLCRKLGNLTSKAKPASKDTSTKYQDYYEYEEAIAKVPAHRILAIRRGEKEKILRMGFVLPEEEAVAAIEQKWLAGKVRHRHLMGQVIKDAFSRLIKPSMELGLRTEMKNAAEEESIEVFSENLRNLLLAPYGGQKITLGIDPGYRTGCKWALVDQTGKLLKYGVFHPDKSASAKEQAVRTLAEICRNHAVEFVCVGNGTASKETFAFVQNTLRQEGLEGIHALTVSEAGASVYSASDLAREEFPDLDLTERSAISIARRFQDPLAELVKIDPKSIGVGQYQHDVSQSHLKKSLEATVESCVNKVGVNLNTASVELLSYVSGLNRKQALSLVHTRYEQGSFNNREALKNVPGFGLKTFQMCAGFLRVLGGDNPLDSTAVHPESYGVIHKIAGDMGIQPQELIGNKKALGGLDRSRYLSDSVGQFTLSDILEEILKPGRDPRDAFQPMIFDDRVNDIKDLKEGMKLDGIITNITNFGAFVDIGVHRDGFVHISQIANHFVKDIGSVCKVNQKVRVWVMNVDIPRARIGLSMKSNHGNNSPRPKKNPPVNVSFEDLKAKYNKQSLR